MVTQKGVSDFVHTAIAAANGAGIVVEGSHRFAQIAVRAPMRELRHAILIDKREHRNFYRRKEWMQPKHHALFAIYGFFFISIAEKSHKSTRGTGGGFDNKRRVFLFRLFVMNLQVLAGEFLMTREIEIGAVVNAFDLAKAKWELELDIAGGFGIVRKLFVRAETEFVFRHS